LVGMHEDSTAVLDLLQLRPCAAPHAQGHGADRVHVHLTCCIADFLRKSCCVQTFALLACTRLAQETLSSARFGWLSGRPLATTTPTMCPSQRWIDGSMDRPLINRGLHPLRDARD